MNFPKTLACALVLSAYLKVTQPARAADTQSPPPRVPAIVTEPGAKPDSPEKAKQISDEVTRLREDAAKRDAREAADRIAETNRRLQEAAEAERRTVEENARRIAKEI